MFSRLLRLAILLVPLVLQADVFMRTSRTAERVLKDLGGTSVYESEVKINGRDGRLTSFVFSETSDIVAARLARKLKLPLPRTQSAIILDVSGKILCRYFVLQAPGLINSTLVTALEQNASAFGGSRSGDPSWPDNIPAMNASAKFTAFCKKTNTTFLTALSHSASAEAAANQAAQAFTGAGWKESVPSTPSFKIMVQGRKQSVVFADANPESGEVTINILQREGSKD